MPPWDTPTTAADFSPRASSAAFRSSDMSRVVIPGASVTRRLNTYTVKSRARLRYRSAKGSAVPFTVFSPSPTPGTITSGLSPVPKRM